MSEIYKDIKDLIINKEYGKIYNTVSAIFISIAPSASYMFMYKRDLFLSLDIIKFSILCIILNFMFLICIFCICVIGSSIKILILENKMKKFSAEEKGKVIDELRIGFLEKSVFNMVINTLLFTLMLWGNYLFLNIYTSPNKPKESTFAMFIVFIIFVFIDNVKGYKKELHDIIEEKEVLHKSKIKKNHVLPGLIFINIIVSIIDIFIKTRAILNVVSIIILIISFIISIKVCKK